MLTNILKKEHPIAPERKIITLGSKRIEFKIIPAAIAIDVLKAVERMAAAGDDVGEMLTILCEVCAVFCSHYDDEITADWLMHNVDMGDITNCAYWLIFQIRNSFEKNPHLAQLAKMAASPKA